MDEGPKGEPGGAESKDILFYLLPLLRVWKSEYRV